MIFIISLIVIFLLLALWDWLVNKDYYEINYMMCPYVTFLVTPKPKLKAVWTEEKFRQEIKEEVLAWWDNLPIGAKYAIINKYTLNDSLSYLFMQEKGKSHIMDAVNKCVTIKPLSKGEMK